ncbi:MAG: FtsX-like permease family protein, partial [Candidatus Competibacteraceae bacterium]|nr:FtsX-like permease family protein [Candidatus Competibacteraceae bacterium]
YPLRGIVELADMPFGQSRPTREIPSPGSVWLDARLFQSLGATVGGSVEVGASRLTVERVLAYEPDRGGDFFSIAPRLMMNLADVPATELVQPGSRVTYRLLLAGPVEAVSAYRNWVRPRLSSGEELEGVRDARPELRVALDRAQRFLGLAALVSVILAGVGIAIAARRFSARHWDSAAVLRAIGATQGVILTLFTLEMLWLALAAGLVGVLLGYLAQAGLAGILAGLAGGEMPLPSLAPAGPALAVGLVTLLGFAQPPLVRLKDVPPLRVLRRDLGPADRRLVGLYLPALAAAGALIFWQAEDARLALYVFGGALGTLVVLALAAWGLVQALGLLRGRVGVAWRFGLANIARRGGRQRGPGGGPGAGDHGAAGADSGAQ